MSKQTFNLQSLLLGALIVAVVAWLLPLKGIQPVSAQATQPVEIPRGAVIAWVPPAGPQITYPEGFGACDGTGGRPQIGDAFLYGTALPGEVGKTGGAVDHGHGITVADAGDSNSGNAVDAGSDLNVANLYHAHLASADDASNLPPFVRVIWICRG